MFPPVALALLALCLIPELWAGKPAGNSIKRSIALFFVAFSAQLFVENVTFYVVCSAAALNIYQCVRYRKGSAELLCYLIGSIMGAAGAAARITVLSGHLFPGRTTRSVLRTVCAGLLTSARNNCGAVFHALLADCPVLYLSITALLGA